MATPRDPEPVGQRSPLVSRRVLLYAGAALPLVLATTPVSRAFAAPSEALRSLRYEGNPAVEITSTTGNRLTPGTYTFSLVGGASADRDAFHTLPDLSRYTTYGGESARDSRYWWRRGPENEPGTATVVLSEWHNYSSFMAGVLLSELRSDVDDSATMTVTTPTGAVLAVGLFAAVAPTPTEEPEEPEEEPETEPGASSGLFGPTGSHWPERTPRVDDDFDSVVDVDPSWSAIGAAIATATAQHPQGKVKIQVRPGRFAAGNGANSSDRGVIADAGQSGRPWRVLVVPRDGWGSVTASGSVATSNSEGYAFVGVRGVSLVGFDFTDQGVLVRNCQDFALGWSTAAKLNVTANGADVTDVELVECVVPNVGTDSSDTMAFRLANGYSIDGLRMLGCYVAPSYKPAGSGSHTDTLQTSRTGSGTHRNLTLRDCVFFQSSSQALMFADTSSVTLDHVAVLGGLRGTDRYPIAAGQHTMTAENALWGGASSVDAANSLLLGSISSWWSFSSVTDTVVSQTPSSSVSSGEFTTDSRYADRTSTMGSDWYAQNCPEPDRSRLSAVWSELG